MPQLLFPKEREAELKRKIDKNMKFVCRYGGREGRGETGGRFDVKWFSLTRMEGYNM